MGRLEDVSVEDLEAALEAAEGKTETKRLLVAIIYKRGPSVPMIAEWLNTREQTIYRWFDRLENEPIREAVTDRPRPGRPPKLSDEQRAAFRDAVARPPAAVGFDEPAWSTTLARRYLVEEFGVEYTKRHVQRLLRNAGLRPRVPRPGSDAEPADQRVQYWELVE
ncbi:MAG: helix-turn-helix domain-containing protein [Haloarculaceae archaeon]